MSNPQRFKSFVSIDASRHFYLNFLHHKITKKIAKVVCWDKCLLKYSMMYREKDLWTKNSLNLRGRYTYEFPTLLNLSTPDHHLSCYQFPLNDNLICHLICQIYI